MTHHKIILFDGVCNFCNFWVNFIIDRDKNDKFRFAALQSESGQEILKQLKLNINDFDTFILADGRNYYTKSTAAFLISKNLKGLWKLLFVFIIIPGPIRNFIYDLIAINRYKNFGKRDVCRIPDEEEKRKFI